MRWREDHHCRHQIEFGRTLAAWFGRRGADAGFFAILAGGNLHAGKAQESFDKQYVRDYLEVIHWNSNAGTGLAADVARKTSDKYVEAYRASPDTS